MKTLKSFFAFSFTAITFCSLTIFELYAHAADITAQQAEEIALKDAKVEQSNIIFSNANKKGDEYRIMFIANNNKAYFYEVDNSSGEIGAMMIKQIAPADQKLISETQATEIALTKAGVTNEETKYLNVYFGAGRYDMNGKGGRQEGRERNSGERGKMQGNNGRGADCGNGSGHGACGYGSMQPSPESLFYTVTFEANKKEYRYTINAENGEITRFKVKS